MRGRAWYILGGVAAVVGGLAWMIKASWILAGRPQPPLLLEIAPFFLAVTATCLGITADGLTPRRRALALVFGCLGMIAGLLAAITELVDTASGAALAVSTIAVLIALVLQDRRGASTERLAWWIGVATLPLNLLGGMLATVDEKLLEVSLAVLALSWIWLGGLCLLHGAVAEVASTQASPPR